VKLNASTGSATRPSTLGSELNPHLGARPCASTFTATSAILRQYADPERADFGAFVRRIGFDLR
jgi:hypothetical protein